MAARGTRLLRVVFSFLSRVAPLVFKERDSQSQEASQTSKPSSDVKASVNRKQTCTASLTNSIGSKHRPLVLLGLGWWPKLCPVERQAMYSSWSSLLFFVLLFKERVGCIVLAFLQETSGGEERGKSKTVFNSSNHC